MSLDGVHGFLDVESAALRAPQVGIANSAPQHILSVGSNLYVSGDSSDVLTVDGNVVCEGVKVGLIEITPSYDLAAVANVGNVTSNTIQFTNPDTGIVATGNVTVGSTLTVSGFRITAQAEANDDLEAITLAGADTPEAIHITNATDSVSPYTGALKIGTDAGNNGGLGVAGNVHVGRGLFVDTDTLVVDSTSDRVGIGKTNPDATLDVDGDAIIRGDLSVLGTTTTIDTDNLRVKDPIIELGKGNDETLVDLGLVMTRPSGSSNVAVIFDEDTDTLRIGYTEGSASDTNITMVSTPLSVNVNGDLSVSSNVEVGTANLFVDTTTGRVGIGKTDPGAALDVVGDVEISSNLAVSGSKFTYDNTNTTVFTGTTSAAANEIGYLDMSTSSSSNNIHVKVYIKYGQGGGLGDAEYSFYIRPDGANFSLIYDYRNQLGPITPVVYRTNATDLWSGGTSGVVRFGYSIASAQNVIWRVEVQQRSGNVTFYPTNTGSPVDTSGLVQVTPAPFTRFDSNVAVNTDDLFVDTVNSRVGIGTTNPKTPLEVSQSSGYFNSMYIQKYLGAGPELATSYVLLLKSESNNPKRFSGKISGVRGYSSINTAFEAEIIAGVGSAAALSGRMTFTFSGTSNSFYAKLVSLTYNSSTYIALALIPTANYNGMSGGIYFNGKTNAIDELQYITDLNTLSNIVDFPVSGGDKTSFTGNVGIGTASPGKLLEIYSPLTNTAAFQIKGKRTNQAAVFDTTWVQKGASGDRSIQQQSYPYSSAGDEIHQWLSWNSTNDGWLTPMKLTANGNLTISGAYSPSDDRLKTNEVFLENATETLLKLKPQKYDKHSYSFLEVSPEVYSNVVDGNVFIESTNTWVDANTFTYSETDDVWYKRTLSDNTHEEAGLIAQDIWYDAPELRYLVSVPNDAQIPETKPDTSDDPTIDPDYETWGRKNATVNYTYLIPYIIKSNQEISTELQVEKTKVATLELQLASVLARLDALESA